MPSWPPKIRITPTYARHAGAQMVSTMVTTGLYGAAILMVIQYFCRHSSNDTLWTKLPIAFLAILATLEAIFANHHIYTMFVTNHDNDAYDGIPFSMPGKTACIFLTAFVAQLFYAWRIWKLGRSLDSRFRFAVFPIVALAVIQLGGGLVQVVVMDKAKFNTVMWNSWELNFASMYINGSATAACDILITIALVVILRSTDVNATRRTQTLLEKLVIYTINRGIITSVFAILSILLFEYTCGTLYYLIPFSSNTLIYIISVVSMLTTREELRGGMERSFHVSDLIMKPFSQNTDGGETSQSSNDLVKAETPNRPVPKVGSPDTSITFAKTEGAC